MWDEITYPFSNFNGATVEAWEWICNFTPHNYIPKLGFKLIHTNIRGPSCPNLIQNVFVIFSIPSNRDTIGIIITPVAMVLTQPLSTTADLIPSMRRTHWDLGAMNRTIAMHIAPYRGVWLQVIIRFADYSSQRPGHVDHTYIVNTMVADVLVTHGARKSSTM